ncbi:MAG: glycoside hydrolase family 3 N-terminal domain-containing protein, partial [Spirochaetota bacterium]
VAQLHSIWLSIGDDGTLHVKVLSGPSPTDASIDPWERMKHGIGQITRPLGSRPISPEKGVEAVNRIQRFLVEKTRLGIPALPHEECLAGLMASGATLFPAGINNGAMWDDDLVQRIAAAIGSELYSVGARQGLAPVLDVCRDARWGRTEECLGEDPYLVGVLASAYVRGLQGTDDRLTATLKHYVGHSLSEGARNHAPVRIGARELRDVFLLPFEMAVKEAGAGSVMPAYHDLDGVPLHESKEYLTQVLREEWGFDGTVVSDYEGIVQLHSDHRTRADIEGAAIGALEAGVDVELPADTVFANGIKSALEKGTLDPALVDRAVMRVLVQKSRLGLFDNPYAPEGPIRLNAPEHVRLAREAAQKSIVLLKNDGRLPLDQNQRIALVGPLADDPLCMLGGYSFPVHLIIAGSERATLPLRTLREELGDQIANLAYAKGCDVLTERPKEAAVFPGEIGLEGSSQKSYISYDRSGLPAAVEAVRDADCVILAVGDLAGLFLTGTVGEGSDTTSLALPGVQMELMEAMLDTGKPVVIVVMSGRPYNLGRGFAEAAAVVQAWLPGQEGPAAITDVLFGRANPGAKLPVSIPRSAGAMPFFYNYKVKSAGTPIQPNFGSVFPFGYGLSYTRFSVDGFSLAERTVQTDGTIEVSCRVTNIGDRTGDEVVQLYTRDLYARLVRPVMELKGFRRVRLEPGEATRLTFRVPCDMLSYTLRDNQRVVEPGEFEIMVGTSSKDIHYRETVVVEGLLRTLGSRWRMMCDVMETKEPNERTF